MKQGKSSRELFLEQRLVYLYGVNSLALKAFDLVRGEMNSNQGFSRYDGTDYYYHLVDTTLTLLNHGIINEDIICASLLHDIVEDVKGFTVKTIEIMFNANIARIVDKVTKKEGIDYKDEKEMTAYLSEAMSELGSALVKTADRMHNITTICDAKLSKRKKKADETMKYFIPFFKECRNKYPRYSAFFFSAKTQIESHLWEIQEHYNDVEEQRKEIEALKKEIEALKK